MSVSRTVTYGDAEVPLLERPWTVPADRVPCPATHSLKPGQRWKDAASDLTHERLVLLDDGDAIPVGAMIARELLAEGASCAAFFELFAGQCVLVNADLVCIPEAGLIRELLDEIRAANNGRLGGLPDVIAVFPDGRIAMREAKYVAAKYKDRLSSNQHAFARMARTLFGSRLDLAVVEWGRLTLPTKA